MGNHRVVAIELNVPEKGQFVMDTNDSQPQTNRLFSRLSIGFLVFLVMGGYLLFSEHQAHILAALPWIILLACPLLHIFMHRGHNHDEGKRNE